MDWDRVQLNRTVPLPWSKKRAPRRIGLHYQILKYAHYFCSVIFNPKAKFASWLFVDNRGHIVHRGIFFSSVTLCCRYHFLLISFCPCVIQEHPVFSGKLFWSMCLEMDIWHQWQCTLKSQGKIMETPTTSSRKILRDNTAAGDLFGNATIETHYLVRYHRWPPWSVYTHQHNVYRGAPHLSRSLSIISLATCATRSHSVRHTPTQAGTAAHTNRQNCANFGTHTQNTSLQTVASRKAARYLTQAHRGTQLRCECVALMP